MQANQMLSETIETPTVSGPSSVLNYGQALNAAHHQVMELDPSVFVFGLGVDGPPHLFGTTKGLLEKFGPKRVFDTPVSEQGLTAMASGAGICGLRPVLIHQRLDFMVYTMDQLVNWMSLWNFKSAGQSNMPVTIRAIVGKNWGQGPQHAKSLHTWFAHIPGLQVVVPGSPADAKGLLMSSILSDDPTIVIEARSLYTMEEEVPDAPYYIKLGKANLRRAGEDVTIVTFGSMVPAVLSAAETLKSAGINADVVDLRTLMPLDSEAILKSVKKTGRLVVAEPGWRQFGSSAEIIALVCEKLGTEMRSSPSRVCWPHSHVPMSAPLEKAYYPTADDVVAACRTSCGLENG